MNKKRLESTSGVKLPPHAADLEEAVLGAVLLERDAYHEIAHILLPEAFYSEKNQLVCQAVIRLYDRGEAADILTVCEELKRSGDLPKIGGSYYVSKLTERVASSGNIEFHMRIILQEFIKREIIRSSTASIRDAYEPGGDSIDLLDNWERELMELQGRIYSGRMLSNEALFNQVLIDNEVMRSKAGTIIGVTSGYRDIDMITGGWQKTDMVVLAARPGMGKTSLILNFAAAAAKAKRPVAIFSLEMSSIQLYKKLCSLETDIPLDMFLRQGMDEPTVNSLKLSFRELKEAPLYIDDTPALTIFDLRRKARKMKREKGIELIIIDYLQLMAGLDGGKGNREQEISTISRGIKALAKELEVPIIALSQLSRQVENRPGTSKVPQLSDLRDSGAIEQDADMVMFIYRPEYYGLEVDAENQSTRGVADIIIAKNRHGALDTVTLRFIGSCSKFVDWNDHGSREPDRLQENTNFLT